MSQPSRPPIGFTPKEIRAFKLHALVMALVAAAIAVKAPPGAGQTLGALVCVLLVPVPPAVIYFMRSRNR